MSDYAQKALNWFLDVVFPKFCLGCGSHTSKDGKNRGGFDYVCGKCFSRIAVKNSLECIGCKRQTRFGLTCFFCVKENKTDQLIIVADLSDPLVEKILKAYKYKFITKMSLPISAIAKKGIKKLMNKGFNLFQDNPLIVPVPLHKRRLNWRGFNQAELLAKSMADTYHINYNAGVLKRITDSKHQADIKSREERLENIKNNFIVADKTAIQGRTIVLVDDICTSGATLNECAGVLKKAGAKKVIGFVIARGK